LVLRFEVFVASTGSAGGNSRISPLILVFARARHDPDILKAVPNCTAIFLYPQRQRLLGKGSRLISSPGIACSTDLVD